MKNQQTIINLIKSISGQANILTIPRIYIDLTKSHTAALLLSQCVYWSDRSKLSGGWFWKTNAEWLEETGLTRKNIETALEKLVDWVETDVRKVMGVPKKHYRANLELLVSAISDLLENDKSEMPESDKSEMPESDISTIAEITTEITTSGADKPRKSGEKKPRQADATFDAIVLACSPEGEEFRKEYAKLNGGWVAKIAANGVRAYPPEKIAQWYGPGGWWYSVRCAGMPNAPRPTPESIKKTIVLAAEWDAKQSTSIKQDVTGGFYV